MTRAVTESRPPEAPLARAHDALIARYGASPFDEEVATARESFQERTGRVFEDDAELYEARTAAFLEWYVLERPLGAEGVTPVVHALRQDAGGEHAEAYRSLATSHRSLFSVEELEEGRVVLADLLGGGRFAVDERRRMHGVSVGDIVEARLIGFERKVRFGRTFLYHPTGTREAIVAHARRMRDGGAGRLEVVDYAASLRIRAERYKHVPPTRVYEAATTEFPPAAQARSIKGGP